MTLYLLRHASTEANERGINASRTDTPLSEKGKAQALALVPVLRECSFDAIIVSPLRRTRETIEPYLESVGNPPVIVDELVIERDLGVFANTTRGDQALEQSRTASGDTIVWRPKDGESILDVAERAKVFLTKLRGQYHDKTILVCSHQNFLRNLELLIINRPPQDFYDDNPPRIATAELRRYVVTSPTR